jgi:hypothetical protein
MEILIPGLLLVAFMAWASTRIKRNAAAAYAAETIETDEFVIQKPEGFLHNLNGDPRYVFEAYSKDFSKVNDKLRVGTATVERIADQSLSDVISTLSLDRQRSVKDEKEYPTFVVSADGAETSYKLAERNGSVYKLEVIANEAKNEPWVETFIDSFRIK